MSEPVQRVDFFRPPQRPTGGGTVYLRPDEVSRLREQLAAQTKALADALEGMEDMVGYVSEYFREKWGHDDYIARAKAALSELGVSSSEVPQPQAPDLLPFGGVAPGEQWVYGEHGASLPKTPYVPACPACVRGEQHTLGQLQSFHRDGLRLIADAIQEARSATNEASPEHQVRQVTCAAGYHLNCACGRWWCGDQQDVEFRRDQHEADTLRPQLQANSKQEQNLEMDAGCLCHGCGARYRVDLNIPDALWTEIGMPTPGGLLCGVCIMRRLEELAALDDGFGYLIATEGLVGPFGSSISQQGEGRPADSGRLVPRSGVAMIAAERTRQVVIEGWTPEHDAEQDNDDLVRAAMCYLTRPEQRQMMLLYDNRPVGWPWGSASWKPSADRVRELVKAAALIAAEIDRLQAQDAASAARSEATQEDRALDLRSVWQCSGCKGYFFALHHEVCPDCGREGYWSGSHAGNGYPGNLPPFTPVRKISANLPSPSLLEEGEDRDSD